MFQVSLVYAEPDAALAQAFGDYLERNCLVRIDSAARITDASPLLEVVERALGSDVLILFLSPHAVPRRLERAEWEPLFNEALEGRTRFAYVTLAECPFPKVLLRNNVFDSAAAVKRWIFSLDPPAERPNTVPARALVDCDVKPLWEALADRPGTAHAASDMAHTFAVKADAEFEGIFWVECRGATVAGVAGEIGAQLGLRLPDDVQRNLEQIGRVLNSRRCLVVLEGAAPEVAAEVCIEDRTSWLLADAPAPAAVTVTSAEGQLAALSSWVTAGREVPHSGEIRTTLEGLTGRPEHWITTCQFARAAIAYYKFHERFAEAFESVEMVLQAAVRVQDREAAIEFARERGWILEGWGRREDSGQSFGAAAEAPVQLALW